MLHFIDKRENIADIGQNLLVFAFEQLIWFVLACYEHVTVFFLVIYPYQ